ncbi:MAG: hypothetical protein GY913_22620, partial [Proteobacteria bacterium]|nr:hypothetical protein [Pseudomonadota bacterium]
MSDNSQTPNIDRAEAELEASGELTDELRELAADGRALIAHLDGAEVEGIRVFHTGVDITGLRKDLGLSQAAFARKFGFR